MSEFDASRIGVPAPLTCGQNKLGLKLGCDEPLLFPEDQYRCTDCEVLFHIGLGGIEVFASAVLEGKLDWSRRVADWIEGCLREGIPLEEVLEEVRRGTWWKGTQ